MTMPDILLAAESVTEPNTLLTVSGLTIIAATVGLLIWGASHRSSRWSSSR